MLARREEEETALERAEALLVAIRGLKDVDDDDKRGNREEEVKEITKKKRRASGEHIPVKPTLETPVVNSTETSAGSDADARPSPLSHPYPRARSLSRDLLLPPRSA